MKKATKITLLFVVIVHFAGLILGCTRQHQPKAYVSVEKPPVKITYIDFEKDISPTTVDMVIRHARFFPYKETKLNEINDVTISYGADLSSHSSTSSTLEIK